MPALLTSISRPPYVAFRKSRILSILLPSVMSSWWNLGFLVRPFLESSSTAFCPNSSFLATIITKTFWKLLHSFQIESNQLICLILLSASYHIISVEHHNPIKQRTTLQRVITHLAQVALHWNINRPTYPHVQSITCI